MLSLSSAFLPPLLRHHPTYCCPSLLQQQTSAVSIHVPAQKLPIVGTLPHVIKNSNGMLDWSSDLLAATPTPTVSIFPLVIIADPSIVEHITKSNFNNYPKSNFLTRSFHNFIGNGKVDSELWKLQRKMASYEFSTSSLRTFPLLRSVSRDGDVLDLQDVLERFAFDSICCIVFGDDPDCISKKKDEGDQFFCSFEEAAHLSVDRAMLPCSAIWKLKKLLDIGSEKRLGRSLEVVNEIIDRFIRSQRVDARSIRSRDFLSQLVKDGGQSNKSLRDMLISFALAGRDTTPSALTWFFWILSSRPGILDKIREEIRSSRASQELEDESFTLDSLRKMSCLHAALSESMRLRTRRE